jgi:hypothetical protein
MYVKLPLLLAGTLAYLSWMTAQIQALPAIETSQLSTSKSLSPLTSSGDPPGKVKPKPSKLNAPVKPVAPAVLGGSKGVMFYCGEYCGGIILDSITAHYRFLGDTPVVKSTTLTNLTNLSDYRLIFIIMPTQNFSAAQTSALQAFITNGGRLVVIGDYNGNWKYTPISNNLLARLAVPIRFRTDLVDGNCNTWFARNYGINILTANLPATGVEYALTSTLQLGAGSAKLLGTVTGNQPFLAAYPQQRQLRGDVVVSGDVHLFDDECSPPNTQLWSNLLINMDDDNDGLLNDWETTGYDSNGDGIVDLNLPGMGANPKRRDIFVEIDWMQGCPGVSNRRPLPAAINQVIAAFNAAGITLHVDYGQGGLFNGGNSVPCVPNLLWPSGFQSIKNPNFRPNRRRIFHYSLWGNIYNNGNSTGLAEVVGDDFLITLGPGAIAGNQTAQAGTFMHELGHNLGLRHGGIADSTVFKPNHLSVMNYAFQLNGLIFNFRPGTIDYARVSPPALNEAALNETIGLNGGSAINLYGTAWYCQGLFTQTPRTTNIANGAINWNCNGNGGETNVAARINVDGQIGILPASGVEWSSLVLASPLRPGIPGGISIFPFNQPQVSQSDDEENPEVIQEAPREELKIPARAIQTHFERLKPSQPQEMRARLVGTNSVSVTWKRPRVPVIDGQPVVEYEVLREEKDNIYTAESLGKTKSLSLLDNSAVRGKTYVYSVVSRTKDFAGSAALTAAIQIP